MNKDKQAKETDAEDVVAEVAEKTEPAGLTVTGDVVVADLKVQFDELKGLIADGRAEVLADSKALADRVAVLEQPVVTTDAMPQFDELKQLIADSRQFTHEVHDAIVERLAKAEAATAALANHVATIAPPARNYPRTKEYTVKDGDTTTKIAKAELGQAGRFIEIATMNYDRYPRLKTNSNNVTPGWNLRLPA